MKFNNSSVGESLRLFTSAVQLWLDRNAFEHAAALAFYTLFSLAPLMIMLVAVVGIVFGEEAARGEISAAIGDLVGTRAAAAVEGAVERSQLTEAGLLPSLLGVGTMLFGATTVFAQMQGSLNHFWGVQARPARSGLVVFITVRLLSLSMVLIVGFLLLISFVVSIAISGAIAFARDWIPVPAAIVSLLDVAISVGVTTLLVGMIFKVLPDVRLQWHDVWHGALVTAILFAFGKYFISLYLTRVAPDSTYGAAGSLVVVLMWVYYSSLILFFGTSLAAARIMRRDGAVTPKKTAVRARVVIQEDESAG